MTDVALDGPRGRLGRIDIRQPISCSVPHMVSRETCCFLPTGPVPKRAIVSVRACSWTEGRPNQLPTVKHEWRHHNTRVRYEDALEYKNIAWGTLDGPILVHR